MKEWRIYHNPGVGKPESEGWDTREDAVKFMARQLKAGHSIKDILWKGKTISAKMTLSLIAEAERIRKQL
jgi:hypothetical protein